MRQIREKLGVVQNIGLIDRILRFIVGCLMMGVPIYLMDLNNAAAWYTNYLIIFSIYPFLTSIVGVDPFYSMLRVKSCGGSDRNQCGTFPYEVDAALGHHPVPENDLEHTLEHSHHMAHNN